MRAAMYVVGTGVRDFRVPGSIDLPQAATVSSVAGRLWMVPRLMRDNPFRDTRIHAHRLGSVLHVRLNVQSLVSNRSGVGSYGRSNRAFGAVEFSRTGERRPDNGQDVGGEEEPKKPMT